VRAASRIASRKDWHTFGLCFFRAGLLTRGPSSPFSPVGRAFFAEEDGIPLPEISDTDHITLTSHPGTLRRRQRAPRETSFPGL
jgi:hypothetical protein